MTLLYLAVAYLLGVALGSWLVGLGVVDCHLPTGLWLVPLALLPLTPLLNATLRVREVPLRWPTWAGFVPPRSGMTRGVAAAVVLCAVMGVLRFVTVPQAGCWTRQELAGWNLPSDAAFVREAPQVTVIGYISNFPTVDDERQEVVVRVHAVRAIDNTGAAWHPVTGQARLVTAPRPRYEHGQPVEVTGRLATPPDFDDFSYREYLARQGIHSHFYAAEVTVTNAPRQGAWWRRWLYAGRARAMTLVERMLPEPHAGLAEGILLGVDAGISDELYDRFNLTGTSHVLVISGSNVALIAALMLAVSRRVVGRWATLVALVGIMLYAVLVGAEAAVVRAAVMGGLVVVAAGMGRRSTALISLAVACWVMVLINPLTLFDVGFQLSAAATLGLVLFAEGIGTWLRARWPRMQGGSLILGEVDGGSVGALLRGMVVDGGVMTVAATVLTLPLVAFHFQRVSVLGVLVNLLIVPVQPLILVAGTLGILSGLVGLTWVAQGLLWVVWLGLTWTSQLVSWAAMLPATSVEVGRFGVGALLAIYGAIALVYVAATRQGKTKTNVEMGALHPARLASPVGLGVLAVIAALVWAAIFSLPDGRLHVYFLDVGQGDGIFVQTPSGRQVLIDGGANREQLLAQLGAVMPWWDRSLDMVLMTHPDRDHIGAQMAVPDRYAITYAVDSPATQDDADAAAWRDAVMGAGAELALQHRGGWLDLGDGVALWVLWPNAVSVTGDEAANENSLVTKLVYGDFSVLLTGDAGIPSESTWLADGLPLTATVLKVGHHGSKTSTSTGLVAAVNPQWAVIQVGADNTYGHPTEDVLAVLAGRTILRNDEDGRIHFATDGRAVVVATER